jgi:pimeloyl-ACP methyl ester carboxylesterase
MKTVVGSALLLVTVCGLSCVATSLPQWGAGALLHPWRRPLLSPVPQGCTGATFDGNGVSLDGWRCRASGARRATLIYLHGVADNRAGALGLVDRFGKRGFEVVAYDSRAHGQSEGRACTYGFFEKQDLGRVLDGIEPGPIVLLGTSLGAAVALQTAATHPRVGAVVAAETFSDLRTIASDRVPFFFTKGLVNRALAIAEREGQFDVDDVSPVDAARRITAPVLLIHGESDRETPPEHSRRVFDALRGPKRLILVPNAAHNGSLRGEVWAEIERWIDAALGTRLARADPRRRSGQEEFGTTRVDRYGN